MLPQGFVCESLGMESTIGRIPTELSIKRKPGAGGHSVCGGNNEVTGNLN